MRYWVGAVTGTLAMCLVVYALARRRRVLALIGEEELSRRLDLLSSDPRSISAFGEIMRPLVWFALAIIALKSVIAYFVLGGARFLSPFDLAGVLAMLGAYGFFIQMQTRYRLSALEPIVVAEQP